MVLMELLTLSAIFLGPIAAVIITRFIDHRRDKYNRKMEIFRKLMRTRRAKLSADHVEALNLIEIEFYKDRNVMANFRLYIQHLLSEGVSPEK
jgi:hypothetical protein